MTEAAFLTSGSLFVQMQNENITSSRYCSCAPPLSLSGEGVMPLTEGRRCSTKRSQEVVGVGRLEGA